MTAVRTYTYVDNSNVFIEGQRVSAVRRGLAKGIMDAINRRVLDFDWNIDYGRLHELVCGEHTQIGAAKLWGSPPPGDSFWQHVRRQGFNVKTYERSHGKEKKVDVAIAHQMTKDAYTIIDKSDGEITLVAGDKDYTPVVEDLVANGFRVIVAFWAHAARDLKTAASQFFSLDSYVDHLASRR